MPKPNDWRIYLPNRQEPLLGIPKSFTTEEVRACLVAIGYNVFYSDTQEKGRTLRFLAYTVDTWDRLCLGKDWYLHS